MARQFKTFTADDLFLGLKILGKLDFNRLAAIFRAAEVKDAISEGKATEEIGIAVAIKLLEVLCDSLEAVKDDLFKLISSKVADKKIAPSEMAEMPIDDFLDLLTDFFMSPQSSDFGKAVLQQRKKIQERLSRGSIGVTPIR